MSSKGSLNKVMIIGNLGADPELRSLPDGVSVVNFSIATTESWMDKNSNSRMEQTEWHRITFFGKLAEILHEYGRKGAKVYVEGTLRTRKWTDKEGNDRFSTEIRGRDFVFLSPRQTGGTSTGESSQDSSYDNSQSQDSRFSDMDSDDIPF